MSSSDYKVGLTQNSQECHSGDANCNKDTFPMWVILLLILFICSFFILGIFGVVAAILLPYIFNSSVSGKSKVVYVKTYSNLNNVIAKSYSIDGKYYTKYEDVKNKAILKNKNIFTQRENKIIMSDGTEIMINKISDKCNLAQNLENYTYKNACGAVIVDINGFDKGPNKYSVDVNRLNDRFILLLYSDKFVPVSDSIEEKLFIQDKASERE